MSSLRTGCTLDPPLALSALPGPALSKGWLNWTAALETGSAENGGLANILPCPGSPMPWAVTNAPLKTVMDQAEIGRNRRHGCRQIRKIFEGRWKCFCLFRLCYKEDQVSWCVCVCVCTETVLFLKLGFLTFCP